MPLGAERHPPRPARDRRQPEQSDPDLRGLGRRRDPHRRDVRRPLVPVQLERAAAARRRRAWRTAGECCRGCRRRSRTSTRTSTRCSSSTSRSTRRTRARSRAARRTTARGRTTTRRATRTPGRRSSTATAATPATTRTNPTWRFNEFTSAFTDANFENGDPTKWVIISAPLVNSGEAVGFYWPQIGDPNPPTGAHPIFSGLAARLALVGLRRRCEPDRCAAGHDARTSPTTRRTAPSSRRSATSPVAATSSRWAARRAANTSGDLTGTVYGSDRTGGSISWLARNKADHGTLWAATSAGRDLRDAQRGRDQIRRPSSWHRIDNATSPTRFPSSIYPDPNNVNHAWVTYSGYNAVDADHAGPRLRRARERLGCRARARSRT